MVFPVLVAALRGLGGRALGSITSGLKGATEAAGRLATGLGKTADKFNEINVAARSAFAGIQSVVRLLTEANSKFEQSVLSATGLLGNSVDITDALGKPIKNAIVEIQALRKPVEEIFKGFEATAIQLVGVTSGDLINSFNVVTRNFSDLRGQSKVFKDDLESAAKLSERFAVSLKALGLPMQQLTQEVRSFLIGDVTNDSAVARSLGFDNAEIRRLKASGELVDEFIRRTESLAASSLLGADKFAGATSNIQDFFELLQREVTVDVFEKLSNTANGFFDLLNKNKESITETTKAFVDLGFEALASIGNSLKKIGELLNAFSPILGFLTKALLQGVAVFFDGISGAISVLVALVNTVGAVFNGLGSIVTGLFNLIVEGADSAAEAWAKLTGQIAGARKEFEKLKSELPEDDTAAKLQKAIAAGRAARDANEKGAARNAAKDAIGEFDKKTKEFKSLQLFGSDDEERDLILKERAEKRAKFIKEAIEGGLKVDVEALRKAEREAESSLDKLLRTTQRRTDAGLRSTLKDALGRVQGPSDDAGLLNLQEQISGRKKEISDIEALKPKLSVEDAERAEAVLREYRKELEEAAIAAKKLGVEFAGVFKDPILRKTDEVAKSVNDQIKDLLKTLQTATLTGRGDIRKLESDSSNLLRAIQTGLSAGVVTYETARTALEQVVSNEFLNAETRTKAFGQLSELQRLAVSNLNQIKQLADLQIDIKVEKGGLSEANAELLKSRNNVALLVDEIASLEKLLNSAFDPTTQVQLNNRLNELRAQKTLEEAKQEGFKSREQLKELDLSLAEADRNIARFKANLEEGIQLAISGGFITAGDSEFTRLADDISIATAELQKLQLEARGLSNVTRPTSTAERREFDNRVDANRTAQIEKRAELLRLEEERKNRLVQLGLRLAEVEQQITAEQRTREALRPDKALENETSALERQLSLVGALAALEEARSNLLKSRASAQLQEQLELQALVQKQRNGTLTLEEYSALFELSGNSSANEQDIAQRIFDLKQSQIKLELQATESRLNTELKIFDLEQKKLELALKQEEIASRRAALAAKDAESQLLIERAKIEADKSLTTEEREAQLKLNSERLKTNKEVQKLEEENQSTLREKRAQLTEERSIREQTLRVQQEQTREEAAAAAKRGGRANRLEREKTLNDFLNQFNKAPESPKGRPQESPEVERLIKTFEEGGSTITPAGLVSTGGSFDFGRSEQLTRLRGRVSRPALQSRAGSPQSTSEPAPTANALATPPATSVRNTTIVNNFPEQGASRAALRLQGV